MRTHIGRDIDLRHRPNLVIALLTAASAVAGLVVGLGTSEISLTWQTPAHVFLIWALLREIDPDHEWLAIFGGASAGTWILAGGEVTTALATAGFMVAARLVVFSTGRRPLPTDLAVISLAALLGYTTAGWVAGFAVGVALYVDDRLAEEHRAIQLWAAVGAAAGATIVAALFDSFPESLSNINSPLSALSVGLALILIMREPAKPHSRVDARHASLIDEGRLHAARSLLGVAVAAATILLGPGAAGMVPVLGAEALAIVSNEIERAR